MKLTHHNIPDIQGNTTQSPNFITYTPDFPTFAGTVDSEKMKQGS